LLLRLLVYLLCILLLGRLGNLHDFRGLVLLLGSLILLLRSLILLLRSLELLGNLLSNLLVLLWNLNDLRCLILLLGCLILLLWYLLLWNLLLLLVLSCRIKKICQCSLIDPILCQELLYLLRSKTHIIIILFC
jgi:hypothetical protein